MSDDLYIVIRNWDRFQHYKRRNPLWIKSYTELLNDPAYRGLTASRRGLLHGLWLLYGLTRTCLPLDMHFINSSLGLYAKLQDIESLSEAGFLTFSASRPLAPRYQDAIPEVEVEVEVDIEPRAVTNPNYDEPPPEEPYWPSDTPNGNSPELTHDLTPELRRFP